MAQPESSQMLGAEPADGLEGICNPLRLTIILKRNITGQRHGQRKLQVW